MVLSRLDRRNVDKIRGATDRSRRTRRSAQIDPERRHPDRHRAAGFGKMPLQRRRRACGIDDDAVGEIGDGSHAPPVPPRIAPPKIFGMLDRDQIMDEADKAGTGTRFEPHQGRGPDETVMRNQKIDEAAAAGMGAAIKRRGAAQYEPGAQAAGEDGGPRPRRPVDRGPRPHRVERLDESARAIVWQQAEPPPIAGKLTPSRRVAIRCFA
jgi:hypothetical protein